jgi:hypothetical protein
MLRPLVRSLVSTIALTCFALIATAGGALPGCPTPGVASHAQHELPGHQDGQHGAPDGRQACVVHLCCAHLALPSAAALAGERLVDLQLASGCLPTSDRTATRPAHVLPFAQAPPAPLV